MAKKYIEDDINDCVKSEFTRLGLIKKQTTRAKTQCRIILKIKTL